MVYTHHNISQLDISKARPRSMPAGVLMCTPEHFDVVDVKNYFMQWQVGLVDRQKAQQQWQGLKEMLERLGLTVETIKAQRGIEDMVFAANSSLCWQEPGTAKAALLSRMYHPSRQRETPFYKEWLKGHGYEIIELPEREDFIFEGGGDGIWHPGKMLLWGGFGHRSTKEVYHWISEEIRTPVLLLELVSDEFYHLDMAFHPLDECTVLYCPDAFDELGRALIEAMYPRRIAIAKEQGKKFFTGNCFSVHGKYVVLQQGDTETVRQLKELGYEPIEADLSEYMKSGGNVTCLKMDLY